MMNGAPPPPRPNDTGYSSDSGYFGIPGTATMGVAPAPSTWNQWTTPAQQSPLPGSSNNLVYSSLTGTGPYNTTPSTGTANPLARPPGPAPITSVAPPPTSVTADTTTAPAPTQTGAPANSASNTGVVEKQAVPATVQPADTITPVSTLQSPLARPDATGSVANALMRRYRPTGWY